MNLLTPEQQRAVANVIVAAESRTDAEIAVVIAPASDLYSSHVLLYGLAFGTLLALALAPLGAASGTAWLLACQLFGMTAMGRVRVLRRLGILLVPIQLRRRTARHKAHQELLLLSRAIAPGAPLVLLYVSVLERYAHIVPSKAVRAHIAPIVWENILQKFTASLKKSGLQPACIGAVHHISEVVTPHFPATQAAPHLRHAVIQRTL